jgi:DNA-binding NarL/FixJ family response regulator
VADDQPELLRAILQLIDGEFHEVAALQDGGRGVEAVSRLNPDLLLLDISMGVLSGIEAAVRLKLKESPRAAKLILVTVHEDPDYVVAAFAVGACGYVLKQRLAVDLLPAIREVFEGGPSISPPNNGRARCFQLLP